MKFQNFHLVILITLFLHEMHANDLYSLKNIYSFCTSFALSKPASLNAKPVTEISIYFKKLVVYSQNNIIFFSVTHHALYFYDNLLLI